MKKHLTIVIKLGTSSIVDEQTYEPLLSVLSVIVETCMKLKKDGHKVILVSSGAIGVGLRRMDVTTGRPKHLPKVQALAAIGQCRLMSLWDQLFSHMRQPVAQILLTRNDIADRTQYLNAQNTFLALLDMDVIPVVNENDTLAVTEIKFGDNDTLSAITAGMVHADYLFLMTDVDCLYDKNPRTNPDAKPIEVVEDVAELEADTSSRGSSLGTGGMSTKIVAARLATSAGVTTVITRSSRPGNIRSIVQYSEQQKRLLAAPNSTAGSGTGTPNKQLSNGMNNLTIADPPTSIPAEALSTPSSHSPALEATIVPPLHTRFLPDPHPIRDRYFWLLHGLAPHGTLYIDEGAHNALSDKAGLLPVGIIDVEGTFSQQECVRLVRVRRGTPTPIPMHAIDTVDNGDGNPMEVGRALVNYSSAEIKRIKGVKGTQIVEVLGWAESEYVAFRENVAFLRMERSRPVTPSLDGPVNGSGVGVLDMVGGAGSVVPRTP
ncbi:putative glutamate 5-kinase [Tothia fuscella]|uniref:Glutamate 5-kinase n=1 Tax=Tothia fuscella TaxID=1048955 RepID=A0A9P4U1A0_9PEZI|nr:putative glutamate 5-kinase [Tothia fuscella]